MIKYILLAASSFIALPVCLAQSERIDTDRPDQTESPATVMPKWMQVEAGFLKQSSRNPNMNQQRFRDLELEHPSVLFRFGLANCFELRLATTYATSKGKEDNRVIDRQNGISGVALGGKLHIFSEKNIRPEISLIAHYDFGRLRTLNKDTVDGASFIIAMQNTLSPRMGVGYNLGIEWEKFGRPPAYVYTLAPGFDIGDDWGAFIEFFGFSWKNEKPQTSIDAGFVFYPNPDIKLDISSGFGITRPAPDWFVSFGGSIRFRMYK